MKNIVNTDLLRCNFEFRRNLWEYDLKFSFGLSSDIIEAGFTNEKCVCIYLVLLFEAFKGLIVIEKVMLWSITKKQ